MNEKVSNFLLDLSMKKTHFFLATLITLSLSAQENIKYQKPSKEILDLVEFERPPSVQYDDGKNYMVFLYRDNYKTIETLSAKELRLGGLRIDPKTNIGSRTTYYNDVKIKNLKDRHTKIKSKFIIQGQHLSWSNQLAKVSNQ